MKKYQIIYADPPWSYNDKMSGHSFSLDHEYETQSKQWISQLPIKDIAEKDCCLFLWATSPLLDESIKVMEDWGFKYKTVVFCWSKYTKNRKLVSNLGDRPRIELFAREKTEGWDVWGNEVESDIKL